VREDRRDHLASENAHPPKRSKPARSIVECVGEVHREVGAEPEYAIGLSEGSFSLWEVIKLSHGK
jgi:hypothetical protein